MRWGWTFILWLAAVSLFSLDPLEYHQSLPVRILGETPQQAWRLTGEPRSLKLVEGALGQQVIATDQGKGMVLYWFDDRIWQISFHAPWDGTFWGIFLGMEKAQLKTVLGSPFMQTGDMMVYSLPDIGFPVEGRFFFNDENRLSDIFYYRSDF